jgi:class 3 adenylate cyclase
MGLRAKLFFWVSLLFLLTAISSYILPRLFIQQDVVALQELFNEEIKKEREDEQLIRKKMFSNRIIEDITSFNGTLLYINRTKNINNLLNPKINNDQKKIWNELSLLISYNPEIGFINVQDDNINFSIAVDNPHIYTSEAIKLTEKCNLCLLKTEEDIVPQETFGPFLSIQFPLNKSENIIPAQAILPLSVSSENNNLSDTLHYLYPLNLLGVELDELPNYIELNPYILGLPLENLENPQEAKILFDKIQSIAVNITNQIKENQITNPLDFAKWINNLKPKEKIVSLKKLNSEKKLDKKLQANSFEYTSIAQSSPLTKNRLNDFKRKNIIVQYIDSFLSSIDKSPLDPAMPIGGTSFINKIEGLTNERYTGGALLNKEIFFNTTLFDASKYYFENSSKGPYSIAQGIALIDSTKLNNYYIGNTSLLKDDKENDADKNKSYLTIAKSILSPIKNTLLFPDELMVFLDNKNSVRLAIDNFSHKIPSSFFAGISFENLINNQSGHIVIRNIPYHYMQLQDFSVIPVRIFILLPDALEPIYALQKSVSNALTKIYEKLSYQLLITTLALLGLALIILGFLSKKITKPITMLAEATDGIVQGTYSDIHLPVVDYNSKDELSLLTSSFAKMIKGLQDKERIRGLLDKVVSKEIASEILKKGVTKLGGEKKVVTVLFSDIRGFTKLTEHLDPEVVIGVLNTYMTFMTNIIEIEGGVIDKYVGDAIMALYGAPIEMHDGPMKAIKTAILMIQKLKNWNDDRVKADKPVIEIGIGIHTGSVVAGNMGADTRLNYTVLGANVNFASRLCSAAKPMEIRVSKETLESSGLKDLLEVEEVAPIIYKGFSEPISTYSVIGFKK